MTLARSALKTQSAKPDIALAGRLFAELSERTGSIEGITRASYGLGEQIAHDLVRNEARRLGLEITTDAASNLYMTLRGQEKGAGIVLGSHLDSVPRGGNYDGLAGVLIGLSVVAGYRKANIVPPRDITVMAIRAEESAWFGASYIGSCAAFGRLAPGELKSVRRVSDGITLGAAIDAAGGNSKALAAGETFLTPATVGVFLEVHIEQGPVLVQENVPVGIVTGIRGSFRHRTAHCVGHYAHSGATPRDYRADAVLATSKLVVELDAAWTRLSEAGHDLTVTACEFNTDTREAAFSKVAGSVDFSLDIRSQSQETLSLMRQELARITARVEVTQRVQFELGAESRASRD